MLRSIRQIARGRLFTLVSKGDSMLPIIQTGDLVTYRGVSFGSIRENDILLIQKNKKLFTHRVIYKTKDYAVTKGDNNSRSDGIIRKHNVVARAIHLKRHGKAVQLEELYAIQSLLYNHEIAKIVRAIQRNKIPVLVLKGLPLHLYFEGGNPKRLYFDCDILIPRNAMLRVGHIMKKQGYTRVDTSLSKQHTRMLDKKTEDSYMKRVGAFSVIFDTHYEAVFMMTQLGRLDPLYPQKLIDEMTGEFLQSRQSATVSDRSIPILSHPHLVVYLMLHFFHHNFKGPFRLSLIHNVIRSMKDRPSVYEDMSTFIHQYHLEGYVYPGFLFLQKYYHTPLPRSFLEDIKPGPDKVLFIRNHVLNESVFEEDNRIQSGTVRFKQLFRLSPGPFWRKSMVFFYPAVIYSVIWTVVNKLLPRRTR